MKQFETKLIHNGYESRKYFDSLVPPIFQSATFTFETAEQGEARFSGETGGYIYSRLNNPTTQILEDRIAVLEGAEKALVFSSGMAAVSAVLLSLTKAGDHILCSEGVYGCTFGLLEMIKEKYQITHTLSPMQAESDLHESINENTALIYIETPINPTMKVIDLQMVAGIASKYNIPVIVDNTFSSPYLQQPLALGCDVVVHSATKYISGHGDVIGGLVAGKKDLLEEISMTTRKDVGGTMSPFDAWLLLRGLKTLHIRLDRHTENATAIVNKLKTHSKVEKIFYPGDKDNIHYPISKNQMHAGGGVLSFTIQGDKKCAQTFLNHLKLIKIAVSLGDAETLIQHPATMTHAVVPEEARLKMGITDNMLRLSVGLEAWTDIWADLEQALEVIS
ncbi:methionine gamma-lyase [Bacillus sp. HMF5848]|uniref:methionine gamma-lyase n=1 Tax=Bacillus sp. HMF5848 TaxID=2495421 RepID=UPI000F79B0CF|nr:methionine gamma-lyase [Bacillus sp. HMF5848]RSK27350.1 methionine gamma-lyase [Bacillus sp. HMF5848]